MTLHQREKAPALGLYAREPQRKRRSAASYSPTGSPLQYHRRCQAWLPGSEGDGAFHLRDDRRNTMKHSTAPCVAHGVVRGFRTHTVDASNWGQALGLLVPVNSTRYRA